MELLPLTLIAPKIQASEIFPALELIMSHQAITEAITETNSQEKRHRLLPTHLIIALIIALNFWSKDSIVDVLKNLVQGLSCSWIPKGFRSLTPSKSSISEARQGMLLTWDRGLHSFKMVKATLDQQCHMLGRIPKNVKFPRVHELPDGSYLSWINPDRKSKKKGATRIQVRVIEYMILEQGEEVIYRSFY